MPGSASPVATTSTTAAPAPVAPAPAGGKSKGGGRAARASTPSVAATATVAAAAKPAATTATPAPAAGASAATPAPAPAATTATEGPAPRTTKPEPGKADDAAAAAKAPPPNKSKSLEEVRAARRAKADGAAPAAATAPAAEPKPAEATTSKPGEPAAVAPVAAPAAAVAKPAETVTTDISDAALGEFTKLNRDLRAAKTRITELEAAAGTSTPMLAKLSVVEKLAKEGKHYDAIKALRDIGVDFDKAAAEVMGTTAAEAEIDPKVKEIRDAANAEIEALKAKLAAIEEGQTKDKAEREEDKKRADADRIAADAKSKEQGTTRIIAEVVALEDKFPFLSKSPDFVRDALNGADEAYPLLVKKLGRDLDDGEKNGLLRAALEEAESMHAGRAKLYATATVRNGTVKPAETAAAPAAEPTPSPTIGADVRGNVVTHKPRVKKTYDQIKAERRRAN